MADTVNTDEVDPEQADGRVLRRLRNREAMVDALGDMLREGVKEPSMEQIATRTGLGGRSAYRHFGSLDDAYAALSEQIAEYVGRTVRHASGRVLPPGASLDERCDEIVRGRFAFYDTISDTVSLGSPVGLSIAKAGMDLSASRAMMQRQIDDRFGDELGAFSGADRVAREHVVATMLSIEGLDVLLRGFDGDRTALEERVAAQLRSALTE